MTVKDKLMIYVYRKSCELEESKKELDYQRKFRPCDSLDLYEIMRQDIEIECYNQIVNDLYSIVLNCKQAL